MNKLTSKEISLKGLWGDFKSFHDAYLVLKNKQQDLLKEQTSDEYGNNYVLLENYTVPYIVCKAFSLELALKFLIKSKNIDYDFNHRINELFIECPYKEEIQKRILDKLKITSDDFYAKLEEISKYFVNWRYFYEHEFVYTDNVFDILYDIVYNYADDIARKVLSN